MNKTVKSKRSSRPVPTDTERPVALRLVRALAFGTLFAILVGLALSLVGTAIALSDADPDRLLLPLALATLAISSLVGGLLTRRTARLSPLLSGLASGATLVLLAALLSPLVRDTASLAPAWRWALRGGVLVFSVLGALLGATAPRRRHRRKKP